MTEHCRIKKKLKEDIKTYADILNSPYISTKEKEMLNMIYIEEEDFRTVGENIGLTESAVKKKHKKLIQKIGKMLKAGL